MAPIRLAGAVACLAMIAGCALPTALPMATEVGVPPGSMLIVGRIELDPPFSPELEQKTHWNIVGDGAIRNRVLIATGPTSQPISAGSFQSQDWQGYIDANWGEYFAVVVPRAPRYLNGVAVPLDLQQQDFLWFPGSMVIRPPEEGNAFYVGTLKYVRDDFNQIVDIQVLDARDEALAFLKHRFGKAPDNLQNALWLRQLPWESAGSL